MEDPPSSEMSNAPITQIINNDGSTVVKGRRSLRQLYVIVGVALLLFMLFVTYPQFKNFGLTIEMEDHDAANHTVLTRQHDIREIVPITIVCQLSGEMGNNLAKLGRCLSLKLWLESGEFYNSTHKLGFSARIALRHQEARKWVKGRSDLMRCFPNTNQFDFSEGNNDDFKEIWKLQAGFYGGDDRVEMETPFHDINFEDINVIGDGLRSFVSKVAERHSMVYNSASRKNISMPFLFASQFQMIDALADKFYAENKEFFRFDESNCCKIKAEPDEHVFHYRNFKLEMPKRWNSLGFHEAEPQQAVELFGHLKEGEKIVIVTRFGGETAQPYVDAFEARGLTVRVVDGQDGPADFCLLMSGQRDLVGLAKSSYLTWAGYLGNATRVIAYSTSSTSFSRLNHTCTSPGLKDKFVFSVVH